MLDQRNPDVGERNVTFSKEYLWEKKEEKE